MTRIAMPVESQSETAGRLCVLGAGNAHDLDLSRLVSSYRSVHLVDIDDSALERAVSRQSAETRARLTTCGGVDLSGMFETLGDLQKMRVGASRIAAMPLRASKSLRERIGGPFDVVISACVLSQMHLGLRTALTEDHPLFSALSYTLNVTHLMSLLLLTTPGGRSILVSDAADEKLAPLESPPSQALDLLQQLALEGNLFDAVDPVLLGTIIADNAELSTAFEICPVRDAWVWTIAPGREFLVYAMELLRRS